MRKNLNEKKKRPSQKLKNYSYKSNSYTYGDHGYKPSWKSDDQLAQERAEAEAKAKAEKEAKRMATFTGVKNGVKYRNGVAVDPNDPWEQALAAYRTPEEPKKGRSAGSNRRNAKYTSNVFKVWNIEVQEPYDPYEGSSGTYTYPGTKYIELESVPSSYDEAESMIRMELFYILDESPVSFDFTPA